MKYLEQFYLSLRQILLLAFVEMKAQYRGTLSGFLLTSINPILNYSIQSFIFNTVLKLKIDHYLLFFMGGLLPWIFIKQSLVVATPSFESSKEILVTYHIPPLHILLSRMVECFINFIFSFGLILGAILYFHSPIGKEVFLLPLSFFLLFTSTFFLAWICAMLNAFFRDLKFTLPMIISIAFWTTPIFYPSHFVPEPYRSWLFLNPFTYMIGIVRSTIYQFSWDAYLVSLTSILLLNLILFFIAYILWGKVKNEIFLRI